jgi:uncharacterized protein YndB with AHSA1/START domain
VRASTDAEVQLELRRLLPASREEVFEAWTRPEVMTTWCAPGPMTTPSVEIDLRPGGAYRIEMRGPDGASHVAVGKYLEIVRNERLVFTWSWDGPERVETLVTIELNARGEETELVLRHARFPTAEDRDRHLHGWNGCLEKLAARFERGAQLREASRQEGATDAR